MGFAGLQDLGNSASDSVDIANFSSIMWEFFQKNETDQLISEVYNTDSQILLLF
jgi:hypothetical protein